MDLEPIGFVKNSVREPADAAWGSVVSEIRLRSELAEGLRGLEDFSHLVIVFLMHEARFRADLHLVRRPRDRAEMPSLGIFAPRARHRPNPIGVTTVSLERLEPGLFPWASDVREVRRTVQLPAGPGRPCRLA